MGGEAEVVPAIADGTPREATSAGGVRPRRTDAREQCPGSLGHPGHVVLWQGLVNIVRVRIVNPHDREVPMYWWSNIAVPESVETRVIVPADSAYSFGYGKRGLRRVEIPYVDDGPDVTYSTNINRACDFFFHIQDAEHPFIAALDSEGRGLIQASTARSTWIRHSLASMGRLRSALRRRPSWRMRRRST